MADWTPDLTLNHDLLDAQHVEIFRKLRDAAEVLDGPVARVEAAVAALGETLVTHLAAEERLMDEVLYPERIRHRSAHELFTADFLRMRDELTQHGATPLVADGLRRRIPDWLRFHIRVNDLPFGAFLARRSARVGEPARPRKVGPVRLS
jgi:hemerythrin